MANEFDVSGVVTAFLLNTCGLPPRISPHDTQAAVICGGVATLHPSTDGEVEYIPLITGSVAEFYIEPMLPLVGDIDVMHYQNNMLAIPRAHPPPTHLPAEFHNYVQVLEIIDSHLPGYVYIQLRYLLTQRIDDSKYEYVEYDEKPYLGFGGDQLIQCLSPCPKYLLADRNMLNLSFHGPAQSLDYKKKSLLCVDFVPCIRCLCWPPQAADWPTRHRNHGWPDSETVKHVASNGCDVVCVAHRQCRQHEWMGRAQSRLSFSRAEIVLINSWMPVQQITYHILRFYAKTERLTESANNSEPTIISNYHFKTLMLWACELKPRSWWTENLNIVRICVELLHTLSVWLTDTRCPHYFVSNCNLLDNSLNVGSVANKLMSIDEEYLSTWLVNNYIGHCAQLCPVYISRLFVDATTSMKIQKAVLEIVRWRVNTSLLDMWREVVATEIRIPVQVSVASLTVRSCGYWMNELTKIDIRFFVYFSVVAMLYVAHKISSNGINDKLRGILSTVLGHNFSPYCGVLTGSKTELKASELVELLQQSAVERLTAYRQLMARDFGSVATILTTDFEALYAYKHGDYELCLQLSTHSVHMLLYAVGMPIISTCPEFIQLLDDDIVSLIALERIISPGCMIHGGGYASILHVTLSLYLMTQCQLKLRHSEASLTQTLECIKVAQRKHSGRATTDLLTLKLIERRIKMLR